MIPTLQLGQTGRRIITSGSANDPYFANVVALLHFNGTNGSTTFTDVKGKTWTGTGNAFLSSTSPKFGTTSLRLDGTGDFLDCVGGADFQFGTGDFTIEFWLMLNAFATNELYLDSRFGGVTSSYAIYDNVGALNSNVTFFANSGDRAATSNLAVLQWYHVALSRASGVSRLFLDGVQAGSNYTDANNYSSTQIRLGHNSGATSGSAGGTNGWIDELRITKGVGRYTSNFTPPSSPFPDS